LTPLHPDEPHPDDDPGECALRDSANQIASGKFSAQKSEQSDIIVLYDSGTFRHLLQSAAICCICR
jgi:hypothetical protein